MATTVSDPVSARPVMTAEPAPAATAAPAPSLWGWARLLGRPWFVPVALPLLWALAFLPFLGTRDLRLEEGRRATPAREMLASGDFVLPTLYGEPYLNKPPLYFWLVAVFGWLRGGVDAVAVRLPSVLAALGCVLVAAAFARRELSRVTRALTAFVLLTTIILHEKGRLGEIDTFLTFLVIAALTVWWHGYRPHGQTWGSWLGVGAILGAAVLAKGPGGLLEFYLPVVAFLAWERRLGRLFSLGHLACVALLLAPTALWLVLLHRDPRIEFGVLLSLWRGQLGIDGAAALVTEGPADAEELAWRYITFPLQVLLMGAPWILGAAVGAIWPWLPRAAGVDDRLRRFLLCGFVAPLVVFWAWPGARPRHIMAVVFPVCVLASAVAVGGLGLMAKRAPLTAERLSRWLAGLTTVLTAYLGVIAVALAAWGWPDAVPAAAVGAVVCTLLGHVARRLCRGGGGREVILGLVAALAAGVIGGEVLVCTTFVPWKAPTDPTRLAREQLPPDWPADRLVYATRAAVDYNFFFYLGTRVQGVSNAADLVNRAPCVAVVTPAEAAALSTALQVRELARVEAVRGGTPALRVTALSPRHISPLTP